MLGIYKFFYKMKFRSGLWLLAHARNLNNNVVTYTLVVILQMNSNSTGADILVHIAMRPNGADILYGLWVQFLKLVPNHFFSFQVTHKMICRVASLKHWLVKKEI